MQIVANSSQLREVIAAWRSEGAVIGFVPTMGYLHAGHLALMAATRERCDRLVVSIFVNPQQFNDPNDLATYPRDPKGDAAKCRDAAVDLLFTPDADEVYPGGEPLIRLAMPALSEQLCGAGRPGHFEGVMLVVSWLFHQVQPDLACFGQKDYQQLAIIRQMVRELGFPVTIESLPTVREEDGLAMSSRNARLSSGDREHAVLINRALRLAGQSYRKGEHSAAELCEIVSDVIHSGTRNQVEYVSLVDCDTLERLDEVDPEYGALIAVAVRCGAVRLIDNLVLAPI